jgi:hypothetical protein
MSEKPTSEPFFKVFRENGLRFRIMPATVGNDFTCIKCGSKIDVNLDDCKNALSGDVYLLKNLLEKVKAKEKIKREKTFIGYVRERVKASEILNKKASDMVDGTVKIKCPFCKTLNPFDVTGFADVVYEEEDLVLELWEAYKNRSKNIEDKDLKLLKAGDWMAIMESLKRLEDYTADLERLPSLIGKMEELANSFVTEHAKYTFSKALSCVQAGGLKETLKEIIEANLKFIFNSVANALAKVEGKVLTSEIFSSDESHGSERFTPL